MIERKLCWRVTRRCNLHCEHCLAGHANRDFGELNRSGRLDALATMISLGVTRITWTGGEPTLCRDLPMLTETATAAGVRNVITTHGLSIHNRWLGAVNRMNDRIRVSFDGPIDIHDRVRGPGTFARAIRAVASLVEHGYHVEANITLLPQTVRYLYQLSTTLFAAGVERIVLMGLMLRESALDNHLAAPDSDELKTSIQALIGNPAFDGRVVFNDYEVVTDRYVVIESDGTILLCSNLMDRAYGSVIASDGYTRLAQALEVQTLSHRVSPLAL